MKNSHYWKVDNFEEFIASYEYYFNNEHLAYC